MVLDLGTDDMAACPSEDYLPDCDCDVNRQDKLDNGLKLFLFKTVQVNEVVQPRTVLF